MTTEQTTETARHVGVRCWTCAADLRVRADLLPTLPLHHRGDTARVELCPRTSITPTLGAEQTEPVEQVVQAWGLAAEATDTAELAGGYVIPNDVLERLGATVEAMAAPLVGLAAQLAAERAAATEDATRANATANDLVRALSALVAAFPATSWATSNDALAEAQALLDTLQPGTPE